MLLTTPCVPLLKKRRGRFKYPPPRFEEGEFPEGMPSAKGGGSKTKPRHQQISM